MQDIAPAFFHDDDADEYEDVDKLFSKLETFAPPSDMVARIMGAVSKLPSPQHIQRNLQAFPEIEGLVVRHDDKEPS